VSQYWKTLPHRNTLVFNPLNVSYHHSDQIPPSLRCFGSIFIYSQETRPKTSPTEARATLVAISARKYRTFCFPRDFLDFGLLFDLVLSFVFSKVVKISGGSTSALKVHLEIHHKSYFEALDYQPKPTPPNTLTAQKACSTNTCRIRSIKPEKQRAMDRIHRSIALWAIHTDQSYDVIQHSSFRNILSHVRSASKCVSETDFDAVQSHNVNQQIQMLAHNLRWYIRTEIKGKTVVASTEHWITRSGDSFAALSMHFVDNFKIRNFTAEVVVFQKRGSEASLSKRWGSWDELYSKLRIPCVAVDVHENRNQFAFFLDSVKHDSQQVSCIDYDLQDIVMIIFQSKYYGDLNNGDDSEPLRKARAVADLLKDSPEQLDPSQDSQVDSKTSGNEAESCEVSRDYVVRWWSTYNLVTSLLKLRQTMGFLFSRGKINATFALSPKDWIVLENIELLLKPFAKAIKPLVDAKYVTASMVPHVLSRIRFDLLGIAQNDQRRPQHGDVVACACDMLRAFDHRYGDLEHPISNRLPIGGHRRFVGLNKAYYFAMLLDPRFKNLIGAKVPDEEKEKLWEALEDEMLRNEIVHRQSNKTVLGNAALSNATNETSATTKPLTLKRKRSPIDEDDYFMEQFGDDGEDGVADEENQASEDLDDSNVAPILEEFIDIHVLKSECQRELSMYREEKGLRYADRITGKVQDPLEHWWKEKHEAFPILWRLAEFYLAIPGTTNAMVWRNRDKFIPSTRLTSLPGLSEDILLVQLNSNTVDVGIDLMKL
jgi:hypothetical protein